MYNKTVLDNGMKVLTEEMTEFKSASIGIWVNTGPRDEVPDEDGGISHFIEHMMFKGTKTRSAIDIAETMDSIGGQLNAFTEKEQTCYYNRVTDEHVPFAIEVLADMFKNSIFDPDEIERERKVILEEIRMYEDDPEDLVFEAFNSTLWGEHSLSAPTLGRKDTISKIERDDFLRFMENYYAPDNVTISAAGNIKHDEIVEIINKHFGMLKGKAKQSERPLPKFHARHTLKYKDVEQTYLTMGGRGVSQKADEKFVFFVLDSILGGSMSSRLFQEIREKRGLVYTVGTFANSFCDVAQFGVYACTSGENLPEVIKVSNHILDDMRENGVTQKEVDRAKEHIKGGVSLGLESTSNRMIRLNKSELYHGYIIPVDEIFRKIRDVTLDQVNEIAKQYLNRNEYSVAILGPVEEDLHSILRS
jgi:predicted Zn-dependent peptidase